jgi:hypothetical protein
VESNNHGLTTITELRHLGYKNLFRRRQLNNVNNRISQEYGWKTTRTSKPLMIDDLKFSVKKRRTNYKRSNIHLQSYERSFVTTEVLCQVLLTMTELWHLH